MKVSEVIGMEGDVIVMQDVFVYEKQGLDNDGNVIGRFRPTGIRPKFVDRIHVAGISLAPEIFAGRK
jgi:pilus assembly protein CpaF